MLISMMPSSHQKDISKDGFQVTISTRNWTRGSQTLLNLQCLVISQSSDFQDDNVGNERERGARNAVCKRCDRNFNFGRRFQFTNAV